MAFTGLAVFYFIALLVDPGLKGPLRALWYFTECTKLFPEANDAIMEYRLEGWSCSGRVWQPLDPRAYFPIEADDKESRFQRIGFFFNGTSQWRTVAHALDDYVIAHHPDLDDGMTGDLGGIRVYRVKRPLPQVGDPVARYVYRPMAPAAADERKDLYYTRPSIRDKRCRGTPTPADTPAHEAER
jgi:hypothetical protein